MNNFFQLTKSLIFILILALLATGIFWNIRALDRAVRNLLEQAAAINAIELFGVKLSFNTATVYEFLNFDHLKPVDKDRVHGKLFGLTPEEFIRMMNIGELKDLCVFETPNAGMKQTLSIDRTLHNKGLAEISDNPETFERVRGKFTELAAQAKLPPIGYPLSCYNLKLTEDGYNAKTVLTKALSRKFSQDLPSQ
jgi:hypothetical protein